MNYCFCSLSSTLKGHGRPAADLLTVTFSLHESLTLEEKKMLFSILLKRAAKVEEEEEEK